MLICLAACVFWAAEPAFQANSAAAEVLKEANESYRTMRSGDAVRLYREYLTSDPANAPVRIFLGAALLNLNQPAEAKKEVQKALALNPELPKAYVLLGRIYTLESSWSLAQESFTHALSLDSHERDALYFSGRAFYEDNRFEQAIERFKQALGMGATQSRTFENLALCYEALDRPLQAEEAFHSAVQFAGDQYRPYLAYGRFLFKQARMDESLQLLTQAFQKRTRFD